MADFSALLSQYANQATGGVAPSLLDQKKVTVGQAADAKKARMLPLSPDIGYQVAAGKVGNTGQNIPGELAQDLRKLNDWQIYQKYGEDAGAILGAQGAADAQFGADRAAFRPDSAAVGDSILSVGGGLANTFIGLGALGAGAVSPRAGAVITDLGNKFNEGLASFQSSGLNRNKQANAALDQMDVVDNNAQYQVDKASGNAVVAELKRFGRGIKNSLSRQVDDPTLLADGVANAAGSVVGSGALMKGLAKIGTAVMAGEAVTGGVISAASKAKYGEALNTALAVGGMEAGGAYQQTMTQALATLKSRSDLTEDEKFDMANRAAMKAAGIQGVVGAVTGQLVGAFERNPLRGTSLTKLAGNAGRETIEESSQNASGQISQNYALSGEVDPNIDIMAGAGEQAGVGALYGFGSAVALGAPGAAVKAPIDAARYTIRAAIRQGDKIISGISSQSPVSNEQVDAGRAAMAASTATVQQTVGAAIDAADMPDEEKVKAHEFTQRLSSFLNFNPDSIVNEHPDVQAALGNSQNIVDAVNSAAKLAGDESASPDVRVSAGRYLVNTFDEIKAINGSEASDSVKLAAEQNGSAAAIQDIERVIRGFVTDPRIAGPMKAAMDLAQPAAPQQVQGPVTPEVQQAAATVVAVAQQAVLNDVDTRALVKINPDTNDAILKQADSGALSLSSSQRAALIVTSALARAEQQSLAEAENLGLRKIGAVSRMVQSTRNQDQDNERAMGRISIADHMVRIMNAMNTGSTSDALRRMNDLKMFAQSMKNKVEALNKSKAIQEQALREGKTDVDAAVTYESWNQAKKVWFTWGKDWGRPVTWKESTVSQRQFIQTTDIDARAVADMYNTLVDHFSEIGAEKIDLPVMGKIGEATAAAPAPKAETKAETKPVEAKPIEKAVETKPAEPAKPATLEPVVETKPAEPVVEVVPEAAPVVPEQLSLDLSPAAAEEEAVHSQLAPEEKIVLAEASQSVGSNDVLPATTDRRRTAGETRGSMSDGTKGPGRRKTVVLKQSENADGSIDDATDLTDVTDETPATELGKLYPLLLSTGKLKNLFLKAYKLPSVAKSYLFGTNVAKDMRAVLTNIAKFEDRVGSQEYSSKLTTEVTSAYSSLLSNGVFGVVQKHMDDVLAAHLSKPHKKTGEPLTAYLAQEDNNAMAWGANRALNIVERKGDGFGYNRELQQAAILAGLQWSIATSKTSTKMDKEDIARMLGIREREVTRELSDWINSQSYQERALQDLSDKIVKYWGLQADKNAPLGWTRGVAGGVAAEVMRALVAAGIVDETSFTLVSYDEDGKKQIKTLRGLRPWHVTDKWKDGHEVKLTPAQQGKQDFIDALHKFPDAIEIATLVDPELVNFIGQAPANDLKTQLRNQTGKLTKQQLKTADAVQKTPYHLNIPLLSLVEKMGVDAVMDMFAHNDLDEKTTNVRDLEAKTSINKTMLGAFKYIMDLSAEMAAYGEGKELELGKVPVFYKYAYTKVQRLMMLGAYNPQNNKFIRELVLPTGGTIDLSTDNPEMNDIFWLGVAQAWDVKIHKPGMTRAMSVAAAKQKMETTFAQSIKILENWVGDGMSDALTADQMKIIRSEMAPEGGPINFLKFSAAMEVARLNRSTDEERKAFHTGLYIEADGVTDGPINALMHLSSGAFDPQWRSLMGKGGFYFGKNKSMNDHTDTVDLYMVAKDFLQKKLRGNIPTKELDAWGQSMRFMLELLLPGFNLTPDGKLNLDRKVTKNPLTVIIYGSGKQGLANKIASEVEKELSVLLTKLARSENPEAEFNSPEEYQKFLSMLGHFTGKPFNGDFVNFKLNGEQMESLAMMLDGDFVEPMMQAINETIESTAHTRDLVRKSIQVKSIYMKYAFLAEVQKLYAEKEATAAQTGWNRGMGLTGAEIAHINNKLKMFAPVVETGTQNIFLGSKENTALKGDNTSISEAFSTTIEGEYDEGVPQNKMDMKATYDAPANAGVSGLPGIVQGTGDGQMVQNIYDDPSDAPEGSLPVYDGIHVMLQRALADGANINRAVYEGWMLNPVQAVSDAYTEFMAYADLKTLMLSSRELFNEVRRAIFTPLTWWEYTKAQTLEALENIQANLVFAAQSAEARKFAISQFATSTDHMAGLGSPHTTEGIDATNMPDDVLDKMLNDFYYAKLAELQAVEAPKQNIKSELEGMGTVDEATGLRTISVDELSLHVESMNIPATQKDILAASVRSLKGTGHTIIAGSKAAILKAAREAGVNVTETNGEETKGFYSPDNKTIYLTQAKSETLVHEIIHAATWSKVEAAIHRVGYVSKDVEDAVERIRKLMIDWVRTADNENLLNAKGKAAYANAYAAITGYGNANLPAAINEFMAWVLSNQELSRAASRTTVLSKMGKIVSDTIKAIKQLIWGKDNFPDDLLSHLRFNTEIILRAHPVVSETSLVLKQSESVVSDERLFNVMQGFYTRVMEWGNSVVDPADRYLVPGKQKLAINQAQQLSRTFARQGFDMTPQEKGTFELLVAAFMTETQLDPNALLRMEDIYKHVMKQVKASSFLADPNTNNPQALSDADKKYNALSGNIGRRTDAVGRSTLLPGFMALAVVNPQFREILSKIDLPKADLLKGKTTDVYLTNLASNTMLNLGRILANEGKQANVRDAIDRLVDQVAQVGEWQQSYMDRAAEVLEPLGSLSDRVNSKVVWGMQTGSQKVVDVMKRVQAGTNSKLVKNGAAVIQAMTAFINVNEAAEVAKGMVSYADRKDGWLAFRSLIAEVVGRTKDNASVYDMIKTIRSTIKSIRQQYREKLPAVIKGKFKRKLSKDELTHLFMLGRTDIAALTFSLSMDQIKDLLTSETRMQRYTQSLEASIQAAYGSDWNTVRRKSQELATFMNTKVVPHNLLRNPKAIAKLYEERKTNNTSVTQQLIQDIDKLVSLYAYAQLDQVTKDSIADMFTNDTKGAEFALSYLVGQSVDEMAKVAGTAAEENYFKGYIPSPQSTARTLKVADDADFTELELMGFERIGSYEASTADRNANSKGYYFAPLAARSSFDEGIIQTVRNTASGVDPVTGYSTEYMTAGRITDEIEVFRARRFIRYGNPSGQPLMPVFRDGEVVAYERSVDAAHLDRLDQNTDLAEVLGIWRGRQVEEAMARDVNSQLLTNLHAEWEKANIEGTTEEFVDVMSDEFAAIDPVTADAVRLIPVAMRQQMASLYGSPQLWVRKSMVANTVGYRRASIGDAWTGTSRWSPATQQEIKKALITMMGKDAYKHLVRGEKFIQNVVSDARVTIVVKSVIVPAVNMLSNMKQLMARGVPITDIFGKIPKKVAEIDTYVRGRIKKIELQAELRAEKNFSKILKIKNEIQSIDDSFKRLSIAPLIAAGEFATISDVGIGREEIDLVEGRLSDYIENIVSKLPDSVKTLGRYAVVGKDTALFQGLQRAMEYGDFISKAILYDDMTTRQRKTKEEALAAITEEYVNYDYLPGRDRTYLESIGLMWFWTFKLRSIKVALSILRNNPFQALLSSFAPIPDTLGSVGSPLTDNAISLALDTGPYQGLDASLGPAMGWHAHQLNPWWNLLN